MTTQARARRGALRTATAGLAVGLGLVLTPGTAAAAPPDDAVTPFVDCVRRSGDGDGPWTAVLGYTNSGAKAVTLAPGPKNKITPLKDVAVPARFEPGTHRGVLSVTVSGHSSFMWHLGDDHLKVRRSSTPACPPPTDMPAEGNGTGAAVGLAVAGLAGAVLVRRAQRRSAAVGEGIRA